MYSGSLILFSPLPEAPLGWLMFSEGSVRPLTYQLTLGQVAVDTQSTCRLSVGLELADTWADSSLIVN